MKKPFLSAKLRNFTAPGVITPFGRRSAGFLGIPRAGVEHQIRRVLEADHDGVTRARRNRSVNLSSGHESAFTSLEAPARVALTEIHLALQDEDGVIGVIVNVLRKLRAGLRHGVVQGRLLGAQIGMDDSTGSHLAHMKRDAFRESDHPNCLPLGRYGHEEESSQESSAR